MHRYSFVSRIEDLLDAEEADRTQTTGIRKSLRWAIAVLAALLITVPAALMMGPLVATGGRLRLHWMMLLPLLYFGAILYFSVGVSYIRRRQIRRNSEPEAGIALHFKDDCIRIDQSQYGSYQREWRELADAINAPKGVLLYFDDGVVNWLPNRVFQDKAEKKTLVEFFKSRVQEATNESVGDSS